MIEIDGHGSKWLKKDQRDMMTTRIKKKKITTKYPNLTNQIGTNKVSVADEIAQVQRVLQASGLKYTLHSAGTTVGRSPCPPLLHVSACCTNDVQG